MAVQPGTITACGCALPPISGVRSILGPWSPRAVRPAAADIPKAPIGRE